jgi:ProP effector
MSKPKITPDVSALLKRLCREYPHCFRPESLEPVPLKHAIHWDLLDALYPDVLPLVLRDALEIYTGRASYQACLKVGAERVDLKGEPAGIVETQRPPRPTKPESVEPVPVQAIGR